jgi:hypothetical protein
MLGGGNRVQNSPSRSSWNEAGHARCLEFQFEKSSGQWIQSLCLGIQVGELRAVDPEFRAQGVGN